MNTTKQSISRYAVVIAAAMIAGLAGGVVAIRLQPAMPKQIPPPVAEAPASQISVPSEPPPPEHPGIVAAREFRLFDDAGNLALRLTVDRTTFPKLRAGDQTPKRSISLILEDATGAPLIIRSGQQPTAVVLTFSKFNAKLACYDERQVRYLSMRHDMRNVDGYFIGTLEDWQHGKVRFLFRDGSIESH